MRKIDRVVVHCSATPEDREVSVNTIRGWHLSRGFAGIGYHYVIGLNGQIYPGRPEFRQGAHCKGKNKTSIGICYVGGCDKDMKPKDTRTEAQKNSLETLLGYLKAKYPLVKISGHRDHSSKACPSFDATKEYAYISNKKY
jgi:N-acetylmuramoyl-L-alanine amidase